MIQLYPKGQTSFTSNGIELMPAESEVNWQIAGRYDFTMNIPREAVEGITFDYGQILKVSVPPEHVNAINLGAVSYYTVSKSGGTPLYSQVPKAVGVSYSNWEAMRSYMAGDKVTYDKKNWQCVTGHGGLSVPPPNGGLWTQIAGSRMDAGKTITTLAQNTSIMKVRDFNSTYMEAATTTGSQGYVKIADVTATGSSGTRTVPAFDMTEQLFTINKIDKENDQHMIRIEAEHISYELGRTILGECSVVGVNPATALLFIKGAMQEAYSGELYTGLDDGTIDADWSWKNAQAAILDPQNGLLKAIEARAIRNNRDIYIIGNESGNAAYEIAYGVNMKTVRWTGDVSSIVTRVYPIAQREDGTRMTLPEVYIDTSQPIPYIRPEVLDTKLKIGQKVTNSDGTEVELTEDEVYTRMRDAGNARFDVDHCDLAEVTLDLDFVHMPDTVEYASYTAMRKLAPADWVHVINGPMGVETTIQMTEYAFDPILKKYKKTKFGETKQKATVAGYNIKSGAVTGRALASGAVTGANIAAGTITAREIEANSITAEQIASKIITAQLIAASAITADEIAAGAISAEKIAAGAITAGKIAAGAITTEKLEAYAITTAKLAAEAVTAEKIAAGAINADKISATAISAINAKLGTAEIADARIASADIGYAQIKDLNAQSAFFGQAVFQEAVGGKLYVPRLSVGYAQMIGATIGDLCIQASNGNYYGIDVDMDGNVTATQRTVTAGEIAAGHTTDGRTLVMGTDILATDLNTQNIYASHALMDEITANLLSVDQLWARTAFINKLMAQDISSNTYIQATIGNWDSGSTITQTINSLDSRISSLGYGTVYFQADEPNHSGLIAGDIWIQSTSTGTWNTVKNDYASWQTIKDTVGTWQTVGGIPKMYIWDGRFWQEMYDAYLPTLLETEIQQLADAIALRATKAEVDALANDVTEFSAQLTIQAQEIQSAVSAVNLKAATYVMQADPRTAYTVSVGDIWIRTDDVATWTDVSTKYATWTEVKNTYTMWQDLLAAQTFVWNGSKWVETSDRAAEIYQKTVIDQTINQVSILAAASATLNDELIRTQASITVANDSIAQEVLRATTAEGGKLDKTSQYQTADAIVAEAVSQAGTQAGTNFIQKTTTYQDAASIVSTAVTQAGTNASANFIAKSGSYTSVNAILAEAQAKADAAGLAAKNACIAQTVSYQTADAIVSAATTYTDGQLADYSTTAQTSTMISQYVGNNAYGKVSGITIESAGIDISGSQYVKIASGGYFRVTSGNFGIKSDAGDNEYAIWSGASTAAASQFRVKKNGEVTLTKLMILNESGQETEVNLRTYGLWKLNYHTVKQVTSSGGYATSMVLSNGDTVNFNSASAVTLSGSWSNMKYSVVAYDGAGAVVGTQQSQAVAIGMTGSQIESALLAYHECTVDVKAGGSSLGGEVTFSAEGVYKAGQNDARNAQTVVGTCYRIVAHSGDWVKVEEIGTGYSRVPYAS